VAAGVTEAAVLHLHSLVARLRRIHPARDAVGERWPAGPAHRF
jgi:hypothetical protein